MNLLCGNAIVGQSGGPTAAINATLSGVIRAVRRYSELGTIPRLFGMRNGIAGLVEERLVLLNSLFDSEEQLQTLEHTPAAALGSCRKRLPSSKENTEEYERIFSVLRKYDIRYFFYIGGNDSMDSVAKLSEYAKNQDYEVRFIGIPKTIDNDLMKTDHSPGFGSAAKYVAVTTQEIIRDCAIYQIPAVTIVEIMGRDTGWLTAASAVGRHVTGIEPDLVYLPERKFYLERFLSDVQACLRRHPNVVVAVSEGIQISDPDFVEKNSKLNQADAFGHVRLGGIGKYLERYLAQTIGCKVRSVELNISQRCAAHLASATDLQEAASVGEAGVECAVSGHTARMMTFTRAEADPYRISIGHEDVSLIANRVRYVSDEYINAQGNHVTDACCAYLLPLIQGEVSVPYQNGLPKHFIL